MGALVSGQSPYPVASSEKTKEVGPVDNQAIIKTVRVMRGNSKITAVRALYDASGDMRRVQRLTVIGMSHWPDIHGVGEYRE